MPVPLIAAATVAQSVAGALNVGGKTAASGAKQRVVDDERARVNAMTSAAQLQAVLVTVGNTPWGYAWTMESRALAQTRLDQLLAANRANAGGGAPASVFSGGPSAAAGTDSFTVATAAGAAAAPTRSKWTLPVVVGAAAVVVVVLYFLMKRRG